MKYLPLLALLFFVACANTDTADAPAPPEALGLETAPEDQPTTDLREIEDYNPDGDERALDELIVVNDLPAEATISSPYTVAGKARGTWFFENSFPVTLTDENGNVLAETYGSSSENWMTADFIPFDAKLEFDAPAGTRAILELMLDNPGSPDEGLDRAVRIPVVIE